jgi:4'-phosphopantetheinyl transferase
MSSVWDEPPLKPHLFEKDVHIWRAGIDLPIESVMKFNEFLSHDEKIRAEHFRFEHDRNRFIASRGILRQILASYMGIKPGEIRFSYEKNGKPNLHEETHKSGIRFNLSHSGELALYSFTQGHAVGVDIEYMAEISDMEQVVEQFFTAEERACFAAAPASMKRETFYWWWTRKEALGKATGVGLLEPVPGEASVRVEEQTTGIACGSGDESAAPKWSIWHVEPADKFAGTVVADGYGLGVRCWQWPG